MISRFEPHAHTEYSNIRNLDSINKVENLIDTAIENGLSGIAITDHECLSCAIRAQKYADKIREDHPDFKVALGNEIYLTDTREPKQKYYHFILIAKDKIGFTMLRKLSSYSWMNSYVSSGIERVPTLKSELTNMVKQYGKGHLIASTACFVKGTKVLTEKGYKNIEDIDDDDFILNKFGDWEKVNFPTSRHYKGSGRKIEFFEGLESIQCTDNHKFLVTAGNWKKTPEPVRWVEAKELKINQGASNHICLFPIRPNYSYKDIIYKTEWEKSLRKISYAPKYLLSNEIKITPEIMRLFGLWLGDGCISITEKVKKIGLSFSSKEFDSYWESFVKKGSQELGINWTKTEKPKTHQIELTCSAIEVVELFYYLFGNSHANNKYIPNRLLHINEELDWNLFFGYALADGYFRTRQKNGYQYGEFVSASISKQLTKDFQALLQSLGIRSSFQIQKEKIGKDSVHHQESYYLSSSNKAWMAINKKQLYNSKDVISLLRQAQKHDEKKHLFINGVKYKKVYIKNIQQIELNEQVYCLNVDSHSFCCENVIVHNCLGGELSNQILELCATENDATKSAINDFITYCKDTFGDDFYLEIAPGCSEEQIIVNKRMKSIAEFYGLKIIIGTDAHYLKKQDRYVHKAYLNAQEAEREVDSFYEYAYLQPTEDIIAHLALSGYSQEEVEQLFKNSNEIYQKIENYSLFHKQKIPQVEVINYPKSLTLFEDAPKDYPILKSLATSDNIQERYWINQCIQALYDKDLYKEEYLDRLEEEADIKRTIGEKLETDMFSYPITLQHYINMIWECGSTIGAGRGSSCSGLNHYLLGITQLDPIKWELPFFRYLNKERVELGDIDIDLAPSKRPAIIENIKKERGSHFLPSVDEVSKQNLGCTLIATFGTETTKSAILNSCFKEGTLVDTIDGEKPIEQIEPNTLVKTMDGFEPVITPTVFYGKPNYVVKTKNSVNENFVCTEDHELLVIDSYRRTKGKGNSAKVKELFPELKELSSLNPIYDLYTRNIREVTPQWKSAKNIVNKHDFGLTVIDTEVYNPGVIKWKNDFKQKFSIGISENIKINEDFCELIGIWIAEGSICKRNNAITFTIHQKEEYLKKRIISLMWKVFQVDNVCITTRKTSQAMTISYSSSQLAQFFFELFGNAGVWKEKRAENTYHYLTQWDKRVPKILMKIEPELQLQIFKGWFLGDGYACKRGGKTTHQQARGTTVSKNLAKDMITILHRNFINPSVDVERRSLDRENLCDCYNLSLYAEYGKLFYEMKYTDEEHYNQKLFIPLSVRRSNDLPVFYNGKLYMKTKLQVSKIDNIDTQKVYCLKMPNGNFSVNNTIVHNCRGYRSDEYPNGLDVDQARYITSLIEQERGFLFSLEDTVYGNKDLGRKPNKAFIKEVSKYPGLLDTMFGIQGLINKRSTHASGVIFFDEDPYEFGCFMKSPSGDICTQWDLHDTEYSGKRQNCQ